MIGFFQAIFPALKNLHYRDSLKHKWYLCIDSFVFHSYQRSTNHLFQVNDLIVFKEFIKKDLKVAVMVENEVIGWCMWFTRFWIIPFKKNSVSDHNELIQCDLCNFKFQDAMVAKCSLYWFRNQKQDELCFIKKNTNVGNKNDNICSSVDQQRKNFKS